MSFPTAFPATSSPLHHLYIHLITLISQEPNYLTKQFHPQHHFFLLHQTCFYKTNEALFLHICVIGIKL